MEFPKKFVRAPPGGLLGGSGPFGVALAEEKQAFVLFAEAIFCWAAPDGSLQLPLIWRGL